MTDEQKKVVSFINLYKQDGKEDSFYGEKDGRFYFVFPASEQYKESKQIYYRVAAFDDKDQFERRRAGERVDGKLFFSIGLKQRKDDPKNTWLGGMIFDDANKKAYFVNLKDNTFKKEGKNHDKYLQLTETEYREKKEVDTSLPREGEDK